MRKIQLFLSILVVFSMFLASCTPAAAPAVATQAPEQPKTEEKPAGSIEQKQETPTPAPTVEASKYKEAPALADQVKAGKLPAVDQRLPISSDIQVIAPVEGVGKYGGTWHNVTWDPGVGNIKMALYEPPVRWKADLTGYEPGLAKSWEWTEDGKNITFHFREGIKWSDGEPFTTDDLKFWWEDLAKNEEYKKVSVPWWANDSTGKPIEMEFPDKYTWVLHFDKAQWIMPFVLAQGFWEWEPLMKPAHYLKQFHPKYTTTATYEDLDLKDRFTETPGYPCLMAWCLSEYTPGQSWVFSRNPFYWKIDTEGNQLPYIDALQVELVQETETRKLSVAQGKYDCTFRGTDDPQDIPFLTEQGKQYDYRLVPGWMNGAGGWPGLLINMDYHEDQEYDAAKETPKSKEIRELIRTKEFRKGLSHAIDRQRVIDVVWDGIGVAQNFTISSQSWHFSSPEGQEILKKWKEADATYDPEMTKQMWDSIGFKDANGDGFRDLPSGTPFDFVVDMNDWGGERVNTDFNEVLRQNLEAVGVKIILNNVIGQAEGSLRGNYGVGWILRNTHPSEVDLWTYPDWVFPLRGSGEGSRAFPMQGYYYQTGGKEGWKPEDGSPAKKLQDLYVKGISEPDVQKRHQIVWDAINVIIEDGPFTLGASGDQPMPVVCKNYFKGVQEYGVLGPWAPASPGNVHPEQFWMDK